MMLKTTLVKYGCCKSWLRATVPPYHRNVIIRLGMSTTHLSEGTLSLNTEGVKQNWGGSKVQPQMVPLCTVVIFRV